MKFGRNLPRNQVPEWSSAYINYKGLKKLIKAAAESIKQGRGADLAEFFFSLDRNLEDVDAFYNKKFSDSSRRLKLLHGRYGSNISVVTGLDRDEIEELRGALLELRGQLRKLQWFGEVNRRGFIKITKKLDKRIPGSYAKQTYVDAKVDTKFFATNTGLTRAMQNINDWLSILSSVKDTDDAKSEHSIHSMKRIPSRSRLDLPSGLLDTVDQAIRHDDAPILKETLAGAALDVEERATQLLFVNLLQRSISCKSKDCISYSLSQVKSLEETDDINQRNCIHRLVISIGRAKSLQPAEDHETKAVEFNADHLQQFITPAASPMTVPPTRTSKECNLLSMADLSVELLHYVLSKLSGDQRAALKSKDSYGRLPLHYAAQFGFVVICNMVMKYMQDWGQFDVSHGIDAPEWQDNEGLAPLHLSVISGHPLTTNALLNAENWQGLNDHKAAMRRNISKSSAVLSLATKANYSHIVKLLVDAGVDINWQDSSGETALHVAARFGHVDCAKILLEGSDDQRADLELAENTYSWTPLHIASVDGHRAIVNLLIDAGADVGKVDSSGWTAKEHAALRGHMDIAIRLAEVSPTTASDSTNSSESDEPPSTTNSSPPSVSSLEDRNSLPNNNTGSRNIEPVKTFGHRYLTKESMILVSLGSMDMRKNVEAVNLDRIPIEEAHSTQLDTALSIIVSAIGADGEATIIDLPVQDNISTEPIVFTASDASKVKLLFDIVPTYAGSTDHKVGRGVAVLSSVKPTLGAKRMNLQGDVSVPILASSTLEVIGCVNFNFLIITPFSHPHMSITEGSTYWKAASTMVIGHRGLGKNRATYRSLQLGENTIQSFIAAANLGANYVEFDVQLTKDHVPVIYHDFLVSETGIDAPVHTLTLEQFLHVNKSAPRVTPRPSRPPSPITVKDTPAGARVVGPDPNRSRSMSMSHAFDSTHEMEEKMKHTRDFKARGFKGNSRGVINAPFTTLEEMFNQVPQDVGFNIEMKYPMLHESEEHEMDTYAVELNSFVDTVLTKVYDMSASPQKRRKLLFSSFNPDICLLLSFKQPSIPVMFLTDAGVCPVGDIRASSLQEAIRFASRWNLLGIVSAAEPFCNSPRLVRVVKEIGLVCVSYGLLNNDNAMVQQQVKEGIDAVIVDNVLAIRQGLTANATSSAKVEAALGGAAAAGNWEKENACVVNTVVEEAVGGGGIQIGQ